jgi:Ca2+-binding RTX toxin-like protein
MITPPTTSGVFSPSPKHFGTTGTGLDGAVTLVSTDLGLNARVAGADLTGGAAAADGVNNLIVQAIRATGVGTDGTITVSDVYAINGWIRANHLAAFTEYHGNDEDGVETGFHLVQNDGSSARLFAEDAVDTILDGLYHIGFVIQDGRFRNEDGDANASVEDVAFWLSHFLSVDLAAGGLGNAAVDPSFHGTTRTGLDKMVEAIVDDVGLHDNLSHAQINAGARAAHGMNEIVVQAIKATGVADDRDLTALDMRDLNEWIRLNKLAQWTTLHGDDENGVETGFHLVQGDGASGVLFGDEAVDTIADGLYHLGFEIRWDRLVNEDGNGNATLDDVSTWLSLLLRGDLDSGTLNSGRAAVDPSAFATDLVFSARTVIADGSAGHFDAGRPAALRQAEGTYSMRFTADAPDNGQYQALFSKDGASNLAGDLSVYLHDGRLYAKMEDGRNATWLEVEDHAIQAGVTYDLAVSFGRSGLEIWLNGEKVAVNDAFTTGMLANTRGLVVGGGTWGRDGANPNVVWNQFDGRIEEFRFYDQQLDRFEIDGLARGPALATPQPGPSAQMGDLPAVLAGTGLNGAVFDRTGRFDSVDQLISQSATQSAPNHLFNAAKIDFGDPGEERTLAQFLGSNGTAQTGGATDFTTIGLKLSGFVWLEAGTHLITVRSDDGFQLSLGGEVLSRHEGERGFEGTSRQIDVPSNGLYAIELFYFDNSGDQALRFEIDGKAAGPERFYKSIADYQQALADNGAAPPGGLVRPYDGPVGTTGTGLDQIIRMIGEDPGLSLNVSRAHLFEGAAAADTVNNLIVQALDATGAALDGMVTTSEMYDLSDYIRANHYAAFVAAHGDDENGSETGFHLLQNDGATTQLFGENAVNTIFDGLYHIGFETVGDRFANEDGNANARVEEAAFWLNYFLGLRVTDGDASVNRPANIPTGPQGSAAQPNVLAKTAMTTVLATGAQTLTLDGAARNGVGNAAANTLTGNAAANVLDGAAGNDTMTGGAGDDVLAGGLGADRMTGGTGNDIYYVDNAGDVVIEATGAANGVDTVHVDARLARYTLATSLENLVAEGTTPFTAIGNAANNKITTGAGADKLDGGVGNDVLDGGRGIDRMTGGLGNDIYVVDTTRDLAIEAAGQGTDTVESSATYTLGVNIERLVLTGDDSIGGAGNALDNVLIGNNSANNLNGMAGADRMEGRGGNDTYTIDSVRDVVVEGMNQGLDRVFSSLTTTLAANVENLFLTGAAALNGTGNGLNNWIGGNSAVNTLNGAAGQDVLSGLGGNDVLIGGAGADRFLFTALTDGTDRIQDFQRGVDDIVVDASTFGGGLRAGALAANLLVVGSNPLATLTIGQFLYDSDDGRLFFDVNGRAAGGLVHFATLSGAPAITALDFVIAA